MNHKFMKQEETSFRVLYNDKRSTEKLFNTITDWLPQTPQEYIIVCIGTDRSTGDALGPLVGSLLTEKKPRYLHVYGTLHQPVHATNLTDYLTEIEKKHRQPFVIAVDACLGKSQSIGQLIAGIGPLQPGAALKKTLPAVGDIHLTGVVNSGGFMDHAILQSTRLSFVMDMAEKIAKLLANLDEQLQPSFIHSAILNSHFKRKNTI